MVAEYAYIGSYFFGFGFFILLLVIALVILSLATPSKTNKHRKKLVDMYVAATVRKLAKEEGLDLEAEYKLFIKESKREKLYEKSLDNTIEDELQEKVIAQNEKELTKVK